TSTRDFYQAVMRMRRFLHDQRILILVPSEVADFVRNDMKTQVIYVSTLIEFMEKNEKEQTLQKNAMSLVQQFREIARSAIYDNFLLTEGIDNIKEQYLEVWIKNTESAIENLVKPMKPIEYLEHVQKKYSEFQKLFN